GRADHHGAHPPLQGRGAHHRRPGRRHAGHAGRGAREDDPSQLLPGSVARAQPADDPGERGGGLVAFEELKERQAVIWGNGPFERISETSTIAYDDLVGRLAPEHGERWLDIACGTGAVAFRAAKRGADVTGVDLAPALVERAPELAAQEG